ncbi:sialidase family protein [Kushneria konosiri]|uniref:Sialidase domain-containing protein n=1 Tax=Kushneria konosiri TaxID=698828 RepID=A0A2Z2H2W9_9GAMM|nr:sialidase family protein [Kushneria konosiri]ARS51493.1 hypothetical protein B9G99_00080 [Kushneria konosiri]
MAEANAKYGAVGIDEILNSSGTRVLVEEIPQAVQDASDYAKRRDDLLTKKEAASISDQSKAKFYVNQAELNEGMYDHFGIMDKTLAGAPYLIYRRGTTHATDAGKAVFRTLKKDGTWTDAGVVLADSDLDYRDPAGGTLPSGRIILGSLVRNVSDSGYNRVVILSSDDDGGTWVERQRIPLDGFEYKFIWGKLVMFEGRAAITAYCKDLSGNYQLKLIVSDDNGDSWQEGPVIYSGSNYYNETTVQYLGGGQAVAISRVAGGSGGNLRVWRSTNSGVTWSDSGYLSSPDGDSTHTLVSPSSSYVVNAQGEPVILLFYGDRTDGYVMMRHIGLRDLISGKAWSLRKQIIKLQVRLGYQTQVVYGNRVLMNAFTEPSSSLAYPVLTEVRIPDIGHLTGGWVDFTPSNGWTINTDGAFQKTPGYRINGDLVELRGVVKGGPVGSSASQAVTVLPEGFRPLVRTMFSTWCQGGAARVDVHAGGAVSVIVASDVAYVSLDNIRFSKT